VADSVAGQRDWHLSPGQYVMRKLPHITALFWAIKILATTLGETAGDYFSQTLGLGTLRAAGLLLAIFLLAVTVQLRTGRFHPALFWAVVVLTSTAGTTISDYINYTSHLGQSTGVLILGSGLAVVMLVWWRSGQTLDVENVATLTGEFLFWIAVVFSNSLGTDTHRGDAAAVGRALLHQRQHHAAVLDRLHPHPPLPLPINRQTGQPQRPNGAVVTVLPN